MKNVQKLNNGTYLVSLRLDDEVSEINGLSVLVEAEIELFEKNYGTFIEDLSLKENIDIHHLVVGNQKILPEKLSPDQLSLLRSELVEIARKAIENY